MENPFTPLLEMSGSSKKPEKSEKLVASPEKTREAYERRFHALTSSNQEKLAQYNTKLDDGSFEDQEGEPEGTGEKRKEDMQKSIAYCMDRIEGMKNILDSGEEIPETADIIEFEEAKEIMGTNFLGPEEIKSAFGIEIPDIEMPTINFSKEILEKLKETHQLILYSDTYEKNGTTSPLTAEALYNHLDTKKKDGTKLLLSTDWYKNEKFFTQDPSPLGWKLVAKELIPDSTSKNYLQQTELLADHVRSLYDDEDTMPEEVREALTEWNDLKNNPEKFTELQENTLSQTDTEWKSAAQTLSSLKLTQLFRESFIEWFYRTALTERITDEKLLPHTYSWTKALSSDGSLVFAGPFVGDGAYVGRDGPGYSDSGIGCAFSAGLL